ncbi:putative MFS multidrug transporter [Teratosphaeria nubilosa]|uniref:Putative MFS multidrug transporter n=1 Tax=Teratosphaeria nubilosa TaxID=161662 RepID=A0A6G1LE93_9PEZI|nr:putative MFS multidrug transporter [Teratosphaeria nubilosa]
MMAVDGHDVARTTGFGDDRRSQEPERLEEIESSELPFHRIPNPDGSPTLSADPLGRRVLAEEGGYEFTGFALSGRKKWAILTVIFWVQISMNFNAAIYAAAVPGMSKHFGVGESTTRLGQFIFLVAYAFGCELWAPWSEELGRKWVLQGSLFLVNIWQIPCALAPSFWTVFGSRLLGGLSSAGGSVTLGMVADMWEPAEQQYAVAFVVLSSVAGSVVAPIFGGFVTQYLTWQWAFWISLIFGAVVQAAHFFVPETRSSILLTKGARYLRKEYPECNVYSPDELRGSFFERLDWKESCKLMWRPYMFLLKEPIVTFLSLLSGFSDALIFTGLDSFGPVLRKWNFDYVTIGLAFIPLLVGYILAYLSFLPVYRKDRKLMNGKIENMKPERRLWWLLYTVPLEPIGLLGFAFCSLGPQEHVPWIAPMIFTALIGIANFAIYMATIDYMVAAYGPYAASATGGNGFCRDFLAGIAALYATPFYSNIAKGTKWQLVIPSVILYAISVLGCIPVYYFYINGEKIRNKSPWATALASGDVSIFGGAGLRPGSAPTSRLASMVNISELVEDGGKAA